MTLTCLIADGANVLRLLEVESQWVTGESASRRTISTAGAGQTMEWTPF